jgi:hypothetical protein
MVQMRNLHGYGKSDKRTVPGINHEKVKAKDAPVLYERLLEVTLDDAYDNIWAPEFYEDPKVLASQPTGFINYDARKLNYCASDIKFVAEDKGINPLEMLDYIQGLHDLNDKLHPQDKNATDIMISRIRRQYEDDIKKIKRDYVN